jgi:hypothetical protein
MLFTKIELKGGEAQRRRNNKRENFEHTSRESKLLSMNVAFLCAIHMFVAL